MFFLILACFFFMNLTSTLSYNVNVITQNGKTDIYIDGKHINLDEQHIISKDNSKTVYNVTFFPGLNITKYNNGGIAINQGSGYNEIIQTTSNNLTKEQREELEKELNKMHDNVGKTMAKLDSELARINNEVARVTNFWSKFSDNFKGWPFRN